MNAGRTYDDVPIVLADRLTAAGWLCAGLRVVEIPDAMPAAEVVTAFEAACAGASRVLITRAWAARLPASVLAARLRAARPLVAVVSSVAPARPEPVAVPDAVRHARRVLGVEP